MNLNETKVRTSVYLFEFVVDRIKEEYGYGAISRICNEAILKTYIGIEAESNANKKLRKAVIKKLNEGKRIK